MDTIILTATNPISEYGSRVKRALFSPTQFFRQERLSLNEAVVFGLLSAWLSAVVAFALSTMNSLVLTQLFERWVQRLISSESSFAFLGMSGESFLYTAGFVILAPFFFLLRILFGSVILFICTRLFLDPAKNSIVSFQEVMRLEATSFVSQWYVVVPIFGTLIAYVVQMILLVAGLRESFQISGQRAWVIVLAPYVFLLILGFIFLFVAFAFFHVFLQDFFNLSFWAV